MHSSQETPIHTNAILEAINQINNKIDGLRQEMNERFNNLEVRLRLVEDKLANVENEIHQIKEMQFVFENELDRLQAASHKSLHLAHESRADIRIIRKEIGAWSKDVQELQKQAA